MCGRETDLVFGLVEAAVADVPGATHDCENFVVDCLVFLWVVM